MHTLFFGEQVVATWIGILPGRLEALRWAAVPCKHETISGIR